MTLLNLFTILNTQSNITPLASFNYNIRPNFLPQSSPLPLTYVVMYLNPMIRSFFSINLNVFFKGEKIIHLPLACFHDSSTSRDRFFKSQFKTTEYDEIIFCFDMPIRIKYYKESVWHAQWLPKVVLPWLVSCCFDPIATIRTLKYF